MMPLCKLIAIPMLCAPMLEQPRSPGPAYTGTQRAIHYRANHSKEWRVTRIKGPGGKRYALADQFAYCTCRWPSATKTAGAGN